MSKLLPHALCIKNIDFVFGNPDYNEKVEQYLKVKNINTNINYIIGNKDVVVGIIVKINNELNWQYTKKMFVTNTTQLIIIYVTKESRTKKWRKINAYITQSNSKEDIVKYCHLWIACP